jgi:hypothetical protein
MAQMGDTLVTRDAVRRAVLQDIVDRAEIAGTDSTELGLAPGGRFLSLGTLREIVTEHLLVDLPPSSDQYAEVSTPARIMVAALCPECGLPANITVNLTSQLTVDDDGSEIAVKSKTKPMAHLCHQLPLPNVADGQVSVEETLDTLRIRILRAVADVSDAHAAEIDPGPPSSLDAVAKHMDIVNESERADLEDALYGYAGLEEPLVELVSLKGSPLTYVLTEAGIAAVAAADEAAAAEDEPDNESDEAA